MECKYEGREVICEYKAITKKISTVRNKFADNQKTVTQTKEIIIE